MKRVAIPTRQGLVDDHFGHCNYYTIYTISPANEVLSKQELEAPQGCGCKSGVGNILASLGVKYLLAGNMGAGAVMALQNSGINVIRGCSGDTDKVINDWLNGVISDNGQECHEHEGCEK